jgi:hypothetical protein
MSLWQSFLRFAFKRKLERAQVIEAYLCRFTNDQIAYMLSLILTGLAVGNHSRDAFDDIDLAAHLYAEATATGETLEEVAKSKLQSRGPYRVALAQAVQSIVSKRKKGGFFALSEFKLPYAEMERDEEDRLGLHLIMLHRIYEHGRNAPLLPELERLGQGSQWAAFWREY